MAPIDINNQDINSITLNGSTDIDTVTVNGQEVFSSQTLPVAYSNLIAWYPFDASTYGGSNADDVTARFNPSQSGDSTAYDGTVSGASYQSNGGVTDINAGANSGNFDISGSSTNEINIPNSAVQTGNSTRTTMCWVKVLEDTGDRQMAFGSANGEQAQAWEMEVYTVYTGNLSGGRRDGALSIHTWSGYNATDSNVISLNEWVHFAATHDGNPSNIQIYLNGDPVATVNNNDNSSSLNTSSQDNRIGYSQAHSFGAHTFEGLIDDVRIYNRDLTNSEISAIYNATKP